jgi:putative DNA primase/helicase
MDFDSFARQHGLILPLYLSPSTKVRRCATDEHPKKRNGAYMYDGERGWVRAWDGDGDTHWWNDPHAKPPSGAERARREAERRAEARRLEWRLHQAVGEAQKMLDHCYIEPHPYLASKGLPEEKGLVTEDYTLFVPMYHVETGALRGGQVIRWLPEYVDEHGEVIKAHWDKKQITGSRMTQSLYYLGDATARELWLVEGYATGLSVRAALKSMNLNATVVVCWNDWNLTQIAPRLAGRRFIFADNDKSGAGERAAKATGLPYCLSDQYGRDGKGEDANDLHQRAGLLALTTLMMKTRRG